MCEYLLLPDLCHSHAHYNLKEQLLHDSQYLLEQLLFIFFFGSFFFIIALIQSLFQLVAAADVFWL